MPNLNGYQLQYYRVLDNSKIISKKGVKEIGIPATFSHKIITGLLRNKLKFNALVLTDALDMKAISDNFASEEAVIKAVLAGVDIAVMPVRIWEKNDVYKLEKLFITLENECKKNPEFLVRVEESVKRILIPKKRLLIDRSPINDRIKEAGNVVGCRGHKLIEKKAASKGITLIKNDDGILPLRLMASPKILVLGNNKARLDIFLNSIKRISKAAAIKKQQIDFKNELGDSLSKKILDADFIILLTYNLGSSDTLPEQIALFANKNNNKLVTISCRNPYDIAYMPSSKANLVIYGATGFDITNNRQSGLTVNLKVAAQTLFVSFDKGVPLIVPTGTLPVAIKDPLTNKILYDIGHGLTYSKKESAERNEELTPVGEGRWKLPGDDDVDVDDVLDCPTIPGTSGIEC